MLSSPTASYRVASATASSPNTALGGSASDIAGVDGNRISGDDDQFQTAIDGNSPDNDNDGIFNQFDLDDDNDGILDTVEGLGDSDGDGIIDAFDLDSDNDGIPDNIEAQSTTGYIAPRTFTDVNNDGVNDIYAGGFTPVNTDGDANPDYLDTDSDGDGITDTVEVGITLSGTVGNNGLDNNVESADTFLDVNGTVLDPSNDPVNLPDREADVNNGGDVDYRDADNDNDGIPDAIDLDDDNDGILDTVEGGGDSDGDGVPNWFDLDSDDDGIPDNVEAQSTTDYIAPSGSGLSMTDIDNDGLDDNYDNNTGGVLNSNGLTPQNSDGVDLPDYLDADPFLSILRSTQKESLEEVDIINRNSFDATN